MKKYLLTGILFLVIFLSGCITDNLLENQMKKQKLEMCTSDPISPDSCYYRVARTYNDSEICGKISNQNYKHQCLGEVNLDISFCNKIEPSGMEVNYRATCYYNIAIDKKNISVQP